MNSSVIILLGNGRRQRVPVKLNTPIILVLEEVCKKQKLNADEYDLKFHNRILDTTSTIQFCGVSNNSQLELVPATRLRVESTVTIFLQLENGERLSGSFLPSTTLWDVISQLCNDYIKSKENPVIIYTRLEVFGDKLRTTSLKMLGLISGNALLRLLHRTVEQLKNQPVSSVYMLTAKPKLSQVEEKLESINKVNEKTVEKSEKNKEPVNVKQELNEIVSNSSVEEIEANISEKSSKNIDLMDKDIKHGFERSQITINQPEMKSTCASEPSYLPESTKFLKPVNTEKMDQSNEISSGVNAMGKNTNDLEKLCFDINDYKHLGERYAVLFRIDSVQSPKFDDATDDFYELTVDDAKTLLRDIKRTRSELEGTEFETSTTRERKKSEFLGRTLNSYPHCVVRIIFPNRVVLQGIFKSSESIAEVIDFTKDFLETSSLDFCLYVSPPKTILEAEQKLVDIGAIPGINMYFSCNRESGKEFLKEQSLNNIESSDVAFEISNFFRKNRRPNFDIAPVETSSLIATNENNENDVCSRQNSLNSASVTVTERPKPEAKKVPRWFKI